MTLEQELQDEQVVHLDLSEYTVVNSTMSVREVVAQMRAERRNCAFVVENDRLVGIFTDRDVLRKVVDAPDIWDRPISEVMTRAPKTVPPDAPLRTALDLMHAGHFRNVPAVDESGRIVGNLTHYSIARCFADRFPEEVYNLPPDPDQVPEDRAGA
jgi:CBS domain-containing protein